MNKNYFTPEQVLMLRENPYTYQVDQYRLAFTKEFKELFYSEYQTGTLPRQILAKYGYDPAVPGQRRVWGFPAISGSNTTNMAVSTKGMSPPAGLNRPLCTLVFLHRKKTNSNTSGTKWIT